MDADEEKALDVAADIATARSLNKSEARHMMMVALHKAQREGRKGIIVSDVTHAENWCAEHGFKAII